MVGILFHVPSNGAPQIFRDTKSLKSCHKTWENDFLERKKVTYMSFYMKPILPVGGIKIIAGDPFKSLKRN